MIRAKTSEAETLTTLGADRLRMVLDEDGLAHICDLLIGQYHDEEMAVIREYATNARDSHIAAAAAAAQRGEVWHPRPIEVTLPLGPHDFPREDKGRFLRVKDYGVGLSVEEIATVFSRIGKSTKDQTNEQVGMMGIGGKSGLCATFGSFQITAVKDGEKAIVMVGRDEATEPVMDLVSLSETDEPNGVEIELPTPKYNKLARKAAAFFQFWPEGSVLVDGEEPKRLKPKVEIAPDMWVCEGLYSKGQRTDFIVMGDVPYPVQLDAKLADDHSLVIFVPIGSVTIAPSREALRMTPETKAEVARLMAAYDQKVRDAIQARVDAAKTKAEATKALIEARSAFASDADAGIAWRGQKIPLRYDVSPVLTSGGLKKGIVVSEHDSEKLSHHSRQKQIFVGTLLDAVLVHGFTGATFTHIHKQKLMHWAEAKGLAPKHYVLTANKLAHGWVDSTKRVDWETIKAIRLNHSIRPGGEKRLRGSYDMYVDWEWKVGVPASDIDVSKPIFFACKDYFAKMAPRYVARGQKTRRQWYKERYPSCTIVEMPDNRLRKFRRDFPMARPVSVIQQEIYDDFKGRVKKADLRRLKVHEEGQDRLLMHLDADRVYDPEIKKAIRFCKRKPNEQLRSDMNGIRRLVGKWEMDEDPAFKVEWKNPLDRYPLVSGSHLEHSYAYMNAVYAQESK